MSEARRGRKAVAPSVRAGLTGPRMFWVVPHTRPSRTGLLPNAATRLLKMTKTRTNNRGVLRVRVSEELTLDAGAWQITNDPDYGPVAVIVPPDVPMFLQVVEFVESKPVPPGYRMWRTDEARAATAVCVRWGSYFAVIADATKPLAPRVAERGVSQIDDDEMARMNVEISAAIQWWLTLAGSDQRRYWDLVHRTLATIPAGPKTVRTRPESRCLFACAAEELAVALRHAWPKETLQESLELAANHGVRIIANTITLQAWRNGPIEDVHAGTFAGYGLEECRLGAGEEKAVIRQAQSSMRDALKGFDLLKYSGAWPPPAERVLPFMTAFLWPSSWTYTEQSRTVELPLR